MNQFQIISPSHSNSLKYISFQNHLAATQIQRKWRGYYCRKGLWSYGGVLYEWQVVHVQRSWRGLQGRRRAARVIRKRVLAAAHKIQGLYYAWHSKRLRLILRLNFLNNAVTVIQSYFRMRVAIRFVRTVRFALHTRKATTLQTCFRRFMARKRMHLKRERMEYLHNHLIEFAKLRLNHDVLVRARKAAPLKIPRVVESILGFTQGMDLVLCNLVGVGKYDTGFHIAFQMAKNAYKERYCTRVLDSSFRKELSMGCTRLQTGLASAYEYDLMPAQHQRMCTAAGLCIDSYAGMGMAAIYMELMALWTRFGRIKQTRVDYYEEALGYMMQHSIIAHHRFRSASEFQPDNNQIYHQEVDLPDWIKNLNDEGVELFFQTALQMPGAVSQYDLLLLLAEWVWYRACILEHNIAAVANHLWDPFIVAEEHDDREKLLTERNNAATQSPSAYDETGGDVALVALEKQVQDEFAGDELVENSSNGMEILMGSTERHVVEQDMGFDAVQEVDESTLPVEDTMTETLESHQLDTFSSMLLHRAATGRKFALRRVENILYRAQNLLAPDSHDADEARLRTETFHDLHMSGHRTLLVDAIETQLPIKLHYMSAAEKKRRKIQASREAREASRAASPLTSSLVGIPHRSIANGPLETQSNIRLRTKAPAEHIILDLQIVQCNRTILVKGSISLKRAVSSFSDFLEENSDSHSSHTIDVDASHSVPKYIEDSLVALRPLVLLRNEVELLSEICHRKQMKLTEQIPATSTANDQQVSNAVLSPPLVNKSPRPDEGNLSSHIMSVPSADGNEPLVNSAIASSEEFNVNPDDAQSLNELDEQQSYRSHRHIDYHLISAYIFSNLHLSTCEETYTDPTLISLTQDVLRQQRQEEALQQHAAVEKARLEEEYLYNNDENDVQEQSEKGDNDQGDDDRDSQRRVSFSSNLLPNQQQSTITFDCPCIGKSLPGIKILLPVIEYRRYVRNRSRLVEYATEILQRVYRGFHGRQLYRRAVRRSEAVHQLHRAARGIQKILIWRFKRRARMATLVQRIYRGWKWRMQLQSMVRASLQIQCCARQRQARQQAAAERRRKMEGVPVVQMLGNGRLVTVGDRTFVLRVSRAGMNYRLLGIDAVRGEQYEGTVYKPKMLELLQKYNKDIVGDTLAARNARVMPWQYDRVVDVIIENLGLMPGINPVTVALGAQFAPQQSAPRRLVLVVDPFATIDRTDHIQRQPSAWQLSQTISAPVLRMANENYQEQQQRRHEMKLMAKPRRRNVNRATLGGKSSGFGAK